MQVPSGHEAIVERLVGDAPPVHRLRPPVVRLVAWLFLPVVVIVSAVAWSHRPDLAEQLRRPPFVLGVGTLLVAALVTAWLALRAAVPGGEPRRQAVGLALALAGTAVLLLPWGPIDTVVPLGRFVETGARCFLMTALMAVPTFVALFVALRRGATLAPLAAGGLAGTAALLLAAAAMRVACPADDALHLITWHMLPIPVGVALSALAGVAWLGRWWLGPEGAGSRLSRTDRPPA
jgi:hypothetical protein